MSSATVADPSMAALIEVQKRIIEYRRLADSGKFNDETSKLIRELADLAEALAREFDRDDKR